MEMAKIAGSQVLVMFLLMGFGLFCAKKSFITPQGTNDLNKILNLFVSPALIIITYHRPYDPDLFRSLLNGFLLAFLSHILAIGVAFLFIRGKSDQNKLERFACIFSNCGFMGIPLVSAMLGSEGIIFISAFVIVFTLQQWSVGVLMLTGKPDTKTIIRNLILNPGVISLAVGLSLFFFSVRLPSPISTALGYVSNLYTPIAMILVGTFIARAKILPAFQNPRVYLVCALRLILIPLLMIPFYRLLGVSKNLMITNFIATACPVAALAAMFPAMYGYDPSYGSRFITVSTLLSVATIPGLVMLLSFVIQ